MGQTPGLSSSVWLALVPPPGRRKALLAMEQELPEMRNWEPVPFGLGLSLLKAPGRESSKGR